MADAAHPIHEAEQYRFPINAIEAMADNRRLYGNDPNDMLLYAGKYIPGFYGGEPLFEYFVHTSRLLYVHQLMEGAMEAPPGDRIPTLIDNEFHVGTLIGMDTRLHTMRPYSVARHILMKNPLEEFKKDELTEEDRAHFAKEMEMLKLFHDGLWKKIVMEMGFAYRQEVILTARTLYKTGPDRDRQRQETVAGIVFAHATIEKLKREVLAER